MTRNEDRYVTYLITEKTLVITPKPNFISNYERGMKSLYEIHCLPYLDKKIILDLKFIEYIDSMSLGMCIEFVNECKKHNHSYLITGLNEEVLKIVDSAQIREYLNVVEDISDIEN